MLSVRAVYVLRSLHLDVITRSRRLKQGEPLVRDVRQIKRHKFGFRPDGVFDALDNAPGEHRDGCVASCVHGYIVKSKYSLIIAIRAKGPALAVNPAGRLRRITSVQDRRVPRLIFAHRPQESPLPFQCCPNSTVLGAEFNVWRNSLSTKGLSPRRCGRRTTGLNAAALDNEKSQTMSYDSKKSIETTKTAKISQLRRIDLNLFLIFEAILQQGCDESCKGAFHNSLGGQPRFRPGKADDR